MNIKDIEKNSDNFTGKIYFDYDVSKLNWFNIGGKTRIYFKPETLKDLTSFLKIYNNRGKIFILGAGSNILFTDKIYDGVVIKLGKNFSNISLLNETTLIAGGSTKDKTLSEFAKENNLPVKAVILSTGETGLAPMVMGLGPVEASNEALRKANLTMDDIDAIEVNEAFAAQVLACVKEWDKQGVRIDMDKVNVDGGAIAIGHPFGATGARMIGHLSETLNRENKRYGLATLCIGGGMGIAMCLERK